MITGIVTYAVHYSLANVISCDSLMLLTDKEKMLKEAFCPLLPYFYGSSKMFCFELS